MAYLYSQITQKLSETESAFKNFLLKIGFMSPK